MAVQHKAVEWIIGEVRIVRKVVRQQDIMKPIMFVTVSFGSKEMEAGEVATHPFSGAELWNTLADITFEATIRDVLDFSRSLVDHEEYRPHAPESYDFFSLDVWVSNPLYKFVMWMFDNGRWRV